MRIAKLLRLMLKNVARSWRTLLFSSIGVVVGTAILIFFVALGYGLDRFLRTEIFPSLPPNEVEVVPEVIPDPLDQFRPKGAFLTAEHFAKIRALPKVTAVFPRLDAGFPGTAYLQPEAARRFFKKAVPQMDLFVDGVDPELVRTDPSFFGKVERFAFHGDDPGKPIPVVLSNFLYSLYLTTIAPSLKLPAVPKELFIGFRFNIRLGVGITRGQARQGVIRERYGEVVGFSNYANRAGITIPAKYVEIYNREYVGEEAARYKSLIVKTATADDKAEVIASLREMKFRPDVAYLDEMVFKMVRILTIIFLIVAVVIVVVTAIQIMHTFFMLLYERKTEIGLLRSLGATQGDIRFLIVSEAFFVGLLAGATGLLCGFGASVASDHVARWFLPSFAQFQTESFFVFSALAAAGALAFAALFCVLGALLPARQAARMEPAQALTVR